MFYTILSEDLGQFENVVNLTVDLRRETKKRCGEPLK